MDQGVTDAQRTHVTSLLFRAVEERHLDLEEYDRRMIRVGSAVTFDELVAVLADLPTEYRWWDPRQRRASDRSGALAIASLVMGGLSLLLSPFFGLGALLGIAAFFVGLAGLRSSRHYGLAVGGIVTGLLSLPLSFMMFMIFFGPGRT